MAAIAVLGLGNFGTALARNWLLAGNDVRGWTVEQEVFDSIKANEINEKYLADIPLTGLAVSMDIAESMARCRHCCTGLAQWRRAQSCRRRIAASSPRTGAVGLWQKVLHQAISSFPMSLKND